MLGIHAICRLPGYLASPLLPAQLGQLVLHQCLSCQDDDSVVQQGHSLQRNYLERMPLSVNLTQLPDDV